MSGYALLILFLVAPARDWRTVRDAKAHCQVVVPSDWAGGASVATAPGHKAGVVVHGLSREQRFDQAVSAAKALMKPLVHFSDGGERVWYSYDGGVVGTVFWYVAVPGDPVCTAQLQFSDPQLEPTARAIVLSLGGARP